MKSLKMYNLDDMLLSGRYDPPGYDALDEYNRWLLHFFITISISVIFLLIEMETAIESIRTSVKMAGFIDGGVYLYYSEMVGTSLMWLCIPLLDVFLAGFHRYQYCFRHSCCNYTLRRLSDPGELKRRIIVIPFQYFLRWLVMLIILLSVSLILYFIRVPKEAIPQDIWRDVIKSIFHWWFMDPGYW